MSEQQLTRAAVDGLLARLEAVELTNDERSTLDVIFRCAASTGVFEDEDDVEGWGTYGFFVPVSPETPHGARALGSLTPNRPRLPDRPLLDVPLP